MKVLTKFMLPLTMAMLVLSNCTKEQTTLSVEDIKGSATITGCLTYTTGQNYEGGKFVEKFAAASDVNVQIKISNSDLAPNGTASGYTVYETKTDADGNYSLEIPALNTGVEIIVKAQPFTGKRTFVDGFDKSNNVIIAEADVVYEADNKTFYSVEPGDIKVCDIMYGYKERGSAELFSEIDVLHGKVGIGQFQQMKYSDFERNEDGEIAWLNKSYTLVYGGYEAGDYTYESNLNKGYTPRRKDRYEMEPYWGAKSGINVLVTVTYPSDYKEVIDGVTKTMTRTFGATTDASGEFEINVPVREKGITLTNVSIDPVAFRETSFKNYYEETTSYYYIDFNKSETLDGIYEKAGYANNGSYGSYKFHTIEGIYSEISVRMVFDPLEGYDENYDDSRFASCNKWGPYSL